MSKTIDYKLDILATLITRGSLFGGVKYCYRAMNEYNQTYKHCRGMGNTTRHRSGKIESTYKNLLKKHLFCKNILKLKDENIKWGEIPDQNENPIEWLKKQYNYTDYEINSALGYFEKTLGVKLKETENKYFVYRLFEGNKYKITLNN